MSRFAKAPALEPSDLFVPKGALSGANAKLFAGREAVVEQGVAALEMPGTTAVIFGDRGVGKTSLAWQLFEIFQGNKEVQARYRGIRLPSREYVCFWIECESRYQNVEGVLLSLLRNTSAKKGMTIRDKYRDLFDSGSQDEIKRAYEFNVGIAKAKFDISSRGRRPQALIEAVEAALREGAENPFELFGRFLSLAKTKDPNKDFILFIDEFDRLRNRSGMGDFVKHTGDIRSVIVGVSETARELVEQHPSSDRKLTGSTIEVPPLSSTELREIFSNASDVVARRRDYKSLIFDTEFLNSAVAAAGGYPAIAQFLGYEAVRSTDGIRRAQSENVVISAKEFELARQAVLKGGSELDKKLKESIGRSVKRALILEKLADFSAGWIDVSVLRNHLDEDQQLGFNPNLETLTEAAIVEQAHGRIKFATPVFRLLVLLARDAQTLYPPGKN